MSASAELQKLISARLAQPGMLSVPVPIIDRRKNDLRSEIEMAAAQFGLSIYVMPPLPTRTEMAGDIIFFAEAEVRVRINEKVEVNQTGVDAYDLLDEVLVALHWAGAKEGDPLYEILTHPLYVAPKPCEEVSDPDTRIIDVIFIAVYGFKAAELS